MHTLLIQLKLFWHVAIITMSLTLGIQMTLHKGKYFTDYLMRFMGLMFIALAILALVLERG